MRGPTYDKNVMTILNYSIHDKKNSTNNIYVQMTDIRPSSSWVRSRVQLRPLLPCQTADLLADAALVITCTSDRGLSECCTAERSRLSPLLLKHAMRASSLEWRRPPLLAAAQPRCAAPLAIMPLLWLWDGSPSPRESRAAFLSEAFCFEAARACWAPFPWNCFVVLTERSINSCAASVGALEMPVATKNEVSAAPMEVVEAELTVEAGASIVRYGGSAAVMATTMDSHLFVPGLPPSILICSFDRHTTVISHGPYMTPYRI